MSDLATAYVQIIPTAEGMQNSLTSMLSSAGSTAGEAAGKSTGSGLAKGLAVAGAATAAIGTAVAAGTKAIVSAAKETAAYGDSVDKTSQKLGLSAQAYQEWDYVLNLAGTDMASMSTGLKTLTNQVDAATSGSADAQAMFAQLGISMEDLSTMSREDLFAATIEGFQGMEDSIGRAALANDLFGKSGQNLTPLFNQTAEDTAAQIALAHEYGMVMSDEMVAASADFADAQLTMQNTLTGLKNNMIGEFLPSMTQVMDGFSAFVAGNEEGLDLMDEGITNFVSSLSEMLPKVIEVGGEIIISLVKALVTGLVDSIPQLMQTGIDLLVSIIGALPEIINTITASLPQIITGIVTTLINNIPVIVNAGVQLIVALVQNLPAIISGVIQAIPQIIRALVQAVKTGLPSMAAAGKDLMLGMVNGIKNAVSALWNAVKEAVGGIIAGAKRLLRIESPSKVFAEIGMFTMEGFAAGIDDNAALVRNAMDEAVNDTIGAANLTGDIAVTAASGNYTRSGMTGGTSITVPEINIYTQPGDDPQSIAEEVAYRLGLEVRQKGAVYA